MSKPCELTLEEIENRFKKNLIIAQQTLNDYVDDAIEKEILETGAVLILKGVIPMVQDYLNKKTGKELVENFINSSFSKNDRAGSDEFKHRKIPEYWLLLAQLPTLEEYTRERDMDPKMVKPLSKEAEQFFIENLELVFPKIKPFQETIAILYQYKSNTGVSFVSTIQKKFVAMIFRSFAVLSIKYINLKRNPKIENGKLIINESTGNIQYYKSENGENLFHPSISIKNAINIFKLTHTDLLK